MQRKEMRSAVYWLWKASFFDAFAGWVEILLLDEPFFRPDERLRLDMGSLVKKIHRERQRTVFTSRPGCR